jgi:hypothetical protein
MRQGRDHHGLVAQRGQPGGNIGLRAAHFEGKALALAHQAVARRRQPQQHFAKADDVARFLARFL